MQGIRISTIWAFIYLRQVHCWNCRPTNWGCRESPALYCCLQSIPLGHQNYFKYGGGSDGRAWYEYVTALQLQCYCGALFLVSEPFVNFVLLFFVFSKKLIETAVSVVSAPWRTVVYEFEARAEPYSARAAPVPFSPCIFFCPRHHTDLRLVQWLDTL